MPTWTRLYNLWRNLIHKARMEKELSEEIDAYLEMLIALKVEQGLSQADARRAALIELGGKERLKERVREVRVGHHLETLLRDLRYGLRLLRKSPGFAAISTLTLALGIGANTAIFSVVYGVLLKPLPYVEDDRLVIFMQSYAQKGLDTWGMSQANFALYRDQNHVFEKIAAFSSAGFNLTGGANPERVQAATVTVDFFDVLGVQPAWGRVFRPEEDVPGKNLVCILSYGLWQRRFGGDPQILGNALLLDDVPREVVGIMPQGFAHPNRSVDLWVPVGLNPQRTFPYMLIGIGRLKPGVPVLRAAAETTEIFWNAAHENPALAGATAPPPEGADMKTIVRPLKQVIVGDTETPLLVLLGAVGLVLLIACANIANLLLARAALRSRELALRFSLGATPGRVIRQLLTESLVLSLAGGSIGAAVAWFGVRLLRELPALQRVPRLGDVSVNGVVLTFAAALAVVTGLFFSLAPAVRARRLGLGVGLRDGLRGSAGHGSLRLNGLLVAAQFSLCLVLLIGAGLLLKSFQRLLSASPGFQPERVLSMRLALPNSKYKSGDESLQFFDNLLERVRAVPGVRRAGIVSYLPFGGTDESDGFIVEGREPDSGGVAPNAHIRTVSPGYFQTLEIPLLRGRDFLLSDRADSPLVAIVDEVLARRYWAEGDAIGKRIRFAWSEEWMAIVGVAAAVKNRDLMETAEPHFYHPYAQNPSRQMYLAARTAREPAAVTAAIRGEVQALDPDLPVFGVQALTDAVDRTLNNQRVTNTLLMVFALIAVLLAAVGIYGVMSLYVANRTNEFGIRLALGAQPTALLRSVLGQGLALTLAGVIVGTAAAAALTRTIAGMLFEVSATDPVIFLGVPLLLSVVGLVACYVPARRATRVDPLTALRYE